MGSGTELWYNQSLTTLREKRSKGEDPGLSYWLSEHEWSGLVSCAGELDWDSHGAGGCLSQKVVGDGSEELILSQTIPAILGHIKKFKPILRTIGSWSKF